MARRRMIDPSFWVSEDVGRLSVFARLLFLGLVSQADDEGRGRAKPAYLRSQLFAYDERVRLSEVENALAEIGRNLAVRFYTAGGNQYYVLEHWHDWQSIDRPKPSRIPAPDDEAASDRRDVGEESTKNRRRVADESRLKEKEREKKEKQKEREKEAALSPCGAHQNVMLTASELEQLRAEYPDWENRIETLSAYMASSGAAYQSHFATIRLWAEREKEGGQSRSGPGAAETTEAVDPMALRAIQRMMAEEPLDLGA